MSSRTERAIKADLTERRALLVAERERAAEQFRRLGEAIPMLTGAINEVERLLRGFDPPPATPSDAGEEDA